MRCDQPSEEEGDGGEQIADSRKQQQAARVFPVIGGFSRYSSHSGPINNTVTNSRCVCIELILVSVSVSVSVCCQHKLFDCSRTRISTHRPHLNQAPVQARRAHRAHQNPPNPSNPHPPLVPIPSLCGPCQIESHLTCVSSYRTFAAQTPRGTEATAGLVTGAATGPAPRSLLDLLLDC